MVTKEMGKPIAQSVGEIDKSIAHLDYYIENSAHFLEPEPLDLKSGHTGQIIHQPLGPILVIQPWNFPVWLPFKTCIPPLILGNSIMLKHSESTP